MAADRRAAPRLVVAVVAVVGAVGVLGCQRGAAPTGTVTGPAPTASEASPVAGSTAPTPPAESLVPRPSDGPPAAALAADGGDLVTGQLGSYVWGDGGSDAPLLPGAPIAVGAGEPLVVTLDPVVGVRSWTARTVPAAAPDPSAGQAVGAGVGEPRFPAPGAGDWILIVDLAFVDGLGSATYFWALTVT